MIVFFIHHLWEFRIGCHGDPGNDGGTIDGYDSVADRHDAWPA